MFSKDDILTLLREGADPTELAQKFADVLNEAVAEKQEAEKAEIQKKEDWKNFISTAITWLSKYAPKTYKTFAADLDAWLKQDPSVVIKEMERAVDDADKILARMDKHLNILASLAGMNPGEKEKDVRAAAPATPKTAGSQLDDMDILLNWLKENNI